MRPLDFLLVLAAGCLLLTASFQLGRDYERINALAAEVAAPVKVVSRAAAAAIVQPRMNANKRQWGEDLRVPGRR